jgi:glycosyltransferase involved in cell wall biosynthesis
MSTVVGLSRLAGTRLSMAEVAKPKASVLVLTYNHERFIRTALQSALTQKTNFSFEVIVADDCSTDQTPAIVTRIAGENPGRIRILTRPANLGICRNFVDAYHACRGEFVAILEGDDDWHDREKLETLVAALETRPDCSFAFHNVRLLFEDGREEAGCCPPEVRPELRLRDFVAHNFVPNCSALVYRNRLIDRFPDWFTALSYYDWPLHVLHLGHGPALYLKAPYSTYRIHSGGAWHGAGTQYRLEKLLEIFDSLNRHLDFAYDTTFRLNANFWRVQTENERLRRAVQAIPPAPTAGPNVAQEYHRVLNSRSYRLARRLAGVKHWVDRAVRRRAA